MSDDGQTASYELSSDTDQEAAPAPAKRARNKMTVAPREKAPRRLCNPATVLTVLQTTAIVDVAAVAKRAAAKQKRAERALAVVESHEMGVVGDPVVYQEGAAEYGVPGLGEETTAPLWYPQSASRGKWHVTPVLQLWADQDFAEDSKTRNVVEKRLRAIAQQNAFAASQFDPIPHDGPSADADRFAAWLTASFPAMDLAYRSWNWHRDAVYHFRSVFGRLIRAQFVNREAQPLRVFCVQEAMEPLSAVALFMLDKLTHHPAVQFISQPCYKGPSTVNVCRFGSRARTLCTPGKGTHPNCTKRQYYSVHRSFYPAELCPLIDAEGRLLSDDWPVCNYFQNGEHMAMLKATHIKLIYSFHTQKLTVTGKYDQFDHAGDPMP